ncbi:MAG: M14 family metallopeptidase [Longimicrobiales bacterium]
MDGIRARGGRRALGTLTGLLAAAFVAAPAPATGQSASWLDFDALTGQLRALANGSERVTLESIGRSHEGRDVWMLRIADPSGAPLDQRPGVLVVGTLSGDHLVGSHLALAAARHLAGGGADEADLGQHVVYVVPRLNPDGAERFFSGARDGSRLNALPYDDDNDGRTDEDGAQDLNGDGVATVMRVADPAGAYMVHPDEPRLMKRADPANGETGTHTLHREGRDTDGDGFVAEDGPGGVDLDRNFQHAYPYWEADAGHYMVSEPESRALMDFMVAHRNVAAILTFGHSDNLVTPPDARGELAAATVLDLPAFADASLDEVFEVGVFAPPSSPFGFGGGPRLRGAQPGRDNDPNSGRRPATTVDGGDREYFSAVSDAYREITGIESVGVTREAEGAFFQWGYFHFGVPSFTTPGWALPEAEGDAAGGADGRVLAGLEAAGRDAFVPWTPFDHPDLGAVEIGGFRPYVTVNPDPSAVDDLGPAHGRFVARLASMLPRVRIADTEVTAHGGGVFTVRATVVNEGYFPSALQHGVVARAVDPVTVQIQVPPEDILTGDDKTAEFPRLDGSGSRRTVTWVVRGRPGASVEIRVRAQKGGSDTATVTLR